MILVLSVIMCVMLPILAVIYDLGQMRMYQQDVKNAQEVAGLACVGVSKGSFDKGASGGAFGAFDQSKCKRVATVTAWANLGITAAMPSGNIKMEYLNKVKHGADNRLVKCNGKEPNVDVEPDNSKQHFSVQIQGICYKPMFIKPSLLNFQMLKKNPYFVAPKFQDQYAIQVQPSYFSAVYDIGKR